MPRVSRPMGERAERVLVLGKLAKCAVWKGKWPKGPWPLVVLLKL